MKFWKKLSLVALISIGIFLVQGAVNIEPARATPYKFSFTSDRANGYFIFDDSVKKEDQFLRPDLPIKEYPGSILEYAVDIQGDKKHIIEQGSQNPDLSRQQNPKTVVYLMNQEIIKLAYADKRFPQAQRKFMPEESPGWDEFAFVIPKTIRNSPFAMMVRFRYPRGSFSDSTAQPKQVPTLASALVFSEYNFPKTAGDLGFQGEVKTTIERAIE